MREWGRSFEVGDVSSEHLNSDGEASATVEAHRADCGGGAELVGARDCGARRLGSWAELLKTETFARYEAGREETAQEESNAYHSHVHMRARKSRPGSQVGARPIQSPSVVISFRHVRGARKRRDVFVSQRREDGGK
eukprot:6834782-Pyramimonas_sp.AAC.1